MAVKSVKKAEECDKKWQDKNGKITWQLSHDNLQDGNDTSNGPRDNTTNAFHRLTGQK